MRRRRAPPVRWAARMMAATDPVGVSPTACSEKKKGPDARYDFVKIYGVARDSADLLLYSISGSEPPPEPIAFEDWDSILVRLTSDDSISKSGFIASYNVEYASTDPPTAMPTHAPTLTNFAEVHCKLLIALKISMNTPINMYKYPYGYL